MPYVKKKKEKKLKTEPVSWQPHGNKILGSRCSWPRNSPSHNLPLNHNLSFLQPMVFLRIKQIRYYVTCSWVNFKSAGLKHFKTYWRDSHQILVSHLLSPEDESHWCWWSPDFSFCATKRLTFVSQTKIYRKLFDEYSHNICCTYSGCLEDTFLWL